MKRNPITLITGALLLVIFLLMLFAFQVRTTEVVVVTTFGKFSKSISQPGLYGRGPWPIQKIYRFDNRIQNFETKYEQTNTKEGLPVLVAAYCGWRISDPRVFLESFNGDFPRAEQELESLVRNVKTGVLGQHPFSELISTNVTEIKFDEIEKEMLIAVQAQAGKRYGLAIDFLNIKQIGLPESITSKVFDRMKAERTRLVKKYQSDGDKEAGIIRSTANTETNKILVSASAEATRIRGEGEREAAKSYAVFKENPELAVYLQSLKTLEQSLKDRTTLNLDQQTPPFNMFNGQGMPNSTGG